MQYQALKDQYQLSTIGFSPLEKCPQHFNIQPNTKTKWSRMLDLVPLLFRLYRLYQWRENNLMAIDYQLIGREYDLIVCNDVNSLYIGHRIAQGKIPVWIDLHEYAPLEYENFWWWNVTLRHYVQWQCRKYLQACQGYTTVCEGVANLYSKHYLLSFDALIYNAPVYQSLSPSISEGAIRLVHHGGAQPQRKLENLLLLMEYLGVGYELHFYLSMPSPSSVSYIDFLAKEAMKKKLPVFFHDAVPTHQIVQTINQYDIGVFILEPVNINYLYALPNKFFEYIQARLAIAVSPNPEMKSLVEQYDLGVVAQHYSAESMAEAIRQMNKEKIAYYKLQCQQHARALSFERNKENMINIANKLTA